MQPGRLLAIIGAIAPLTLPRITTAQGGSGIQLFSAYNNSFPGGAGVAGFGLTVGSRLIGVRGTFGLGVSSFTGSQSTSTTTTTSPATIERWSGDADLLIADDFLGLGGLLGGLVHPYGFAGIGLQSSITSPTIDAGVRTWSYGGGVAVPISSAVSLDGEIRNRAQLGSTYVPSTDFVPGAEYRVGISVSFGGSGRGSRSSSNSAHVPSSGSGSGRSAPRTVWPTSAVPATGAARRVVPDGEQYLGVPYVYGGSTTKGFDCSGFVQYVYRHEGVDLPRTSRQMAGSGIAIDPAPLQMAVGDLMLFAQGGQISHVAIYAGGGRFIHSSSSGHGVRYDDLTSQRGQWFADHLVAVRRVATGAGTATRVAAFAASVIPFDHFDPPDSAPPVKRP